MLHFRRNRVEKKFVMDLEDHVALQSFGCKAPVNIDHGDLDYVSRSALDRCIDCISFCQRADCAVLGIDVGQIAAPAEYSLYITVFASGGQCVIDI